MTPAVGPPLRIGCVQYLNARPLIEGWPGQVSFNHPAALCEDLAVGQLEVALVSSFEFLRSPIYSIVDRVSIASDGPVFSVFLAHEVNLDDLHRIEVDPASRTSVNLLRCLFEDAGRRTPLISTALHDDSRLSPKTGRLLIGDQAIRFRQKYGTAYRYLDLGDQWRQMTGLPFVYALWLIRPEVADAESIAQQLRERRDANVLQLEELARTQPNFSAEFCHFYWRDCLTFEFGDREKAGLLKFRSLCETHGILEPASAPLRVA